MYHQKTLLCMFTLFMIPASTFAALTPVSVNNAGTIGNLNSNQAIMTPDWKYVLFQSAANNLVSNDTNWQADLFLRDTTAWTTTRVNVSSAGTQSNNALRSGFSITPDGRYVVFSSFASNLVPNDTNNKIDVFVRDTIAGSTSRISISSAGTQGNADSHHANVTPAFNLINNYDLVSSNITITPDWRYVLFLSHASNLVPNDTNGGSDIFMRDTVAGTTTRINISSAWVQDNNSSFLPKISSNGRYVVFESYASNLVPNDTNGVQDVFMRDTVAGTTSLISISTQGQASNSYSAYSSMTPDGRYVAFQSYASNLVPNDTNGYFDVFVRDVVAGTTKIISVSSAWVQGSTYWMIIRITPDWRYVAFESRDRKLTIPNDTNWVQDVFMRDTVAGITTKISATYNNRPINTPTEGDETTTLIWISNDGRYVLFKSIASNIVAWDTNGTIDIFLRDTIAGTTTRISTDDLGNQIASTYNIQTPMLSALGDKVLFSINKSIHPVDTNGTIRDVYMYQSLAIPPVWPWEYFIDGWQGGGIYWVCEVIPWFTQASRTQEDANYSSFTNKNVVTEFDIFFDNHPVNCHRTAVADFAPGSLTATLTFIDWMWPWDFTCGTMNYCSAFWWQSITSITEY